METICIVTLSIMIISASSPQLNYQSIIECLYLSRQIEMYAMESIDKGL